MHGLLRPVALAGVLAAFSVLTLTGCGNGTKSSQSGTTTSHTRTVPETPQEGTIGNVTPPPPRKPGETADPDSLNAGGADAEWVVQWLGNGRYALHITNTSRIGFIDQIVWRPPHGDRIRTVGSATRGSCTLTNGRVACSGLKLKPPKCLCRPGGTATVIFTMDSPDERSGVVTGALVITGMTPVPYIIPSVPGEGKSE